MDELTKARNNAFSIQSAPEDASFIYIGDVTEDGWIYRYYRDCEGNYWFRTYVITERGAVTLHEYVHGTKEPYMGRWGTKRRGRR